MPHLSEGVRIERESCFNQHICGNVDQKFQVIFHFFTNF